ncbi:MAG: hypothetical protein JXA42_14500, partial [Anaerolineales bacterium]|nr:hypothetical protein [Anaerolineales bacterium]
MTIPLMNHLVSLYHQTTAEIKLFWQSREAVYMTFLIPLLGMALFVYLNREGLLEGVFGVLLQGLGGPGEL